MPIQRTTSDFGAIMMLKFSRRLISLVCFGLLVLSITPGFASTFSTMPLAARDAMGKGERAYEVQDYLSAIDHFQKARLVAPRAAEIFFYLGVAESKIPGRELRAISWLGAYLTARGDASNVGAVKNQIGALRSAHQKTLLRLVKSLDDAARFAERKGPSLRDVSRKLAEIGDFSSAMQVAANLSELPESQAEAYAAIAQVQAATSDIAGALMTAGLIDDSRPAKGDALLHILQFQMARDLAGAQATIERIRSPNTKDRANRIYSYFQARSKDMVGAIKTAGSIQDEEIQGAARSDIAQAQVDAGDLAGALKTAILIPAVGDGNFVLQHISLSQARKGDIDGALKTAPLYSAHSDLQSRVARVQAERGDFAGALKTVALIEMDEKDYSVKSTVQASIAQTQMRGGDADGARKMLASARKSADLVLDTDRKDTVLGQIALIHAESGDVAGALAVAGQIQSAYWKGMTQSDIVVAQAKGGDVAGAIKTSGLIQGKDDDLKGSALARLVDIQAKGGNIAGALRTADLIQSRDRKGSAQHIVVELQVQRGDLAGAQKTVNVMQAHQHQKEAQKAVDQGRFKAGDLVTLWLQRLNDADPNSDCALATAPFLDLSSHLQGLSASGDPKKLFGALYSTFIDMIDAERIVNQLLEQQTGK